MERREDEYGFQEMQPEGEEPNELQQLSIFQRCGIGMLCFVLTCYFIPMLSFIPLAIFGGLHTPSPWAGQYNQEAPVPVVPSKEMPTGRWYWSLPMASLVLILVPTGIVFTMYKLKMRSMRRQQLAEGFVEDCVQADA
ncbi:unnamed protein product [Effrenium voratum]|uniref:Uncharacterized protein n=1 Tax=Effrenium voratum TaxID=2562239 RepID=A0AA36MR54_9DINO|nr:unnamed protein product [Effrenium voratum]